MENNNTIKLTEAQEAFVKMANEEGFTTEITRKDIILMKYKMKLLPNQIVSNHHKIKIWGFLTPILTKKNKERTNKMDISHKIRGIKWHMCLTSMPIHDSIAV